MAHLLHPSFRKTKPQTMRKIFYTSSLLTLLLIFSGCKNSQVLKCPDVSAGGIHHGSWARAPHTRPLNVATAHETNKVVAPKAKEEAVATASNEVQPYQLKLPRIAAGKMNDDELESVNGTFTKYSGNKVHLERNANGRIYLKAKSATDIFKLATTLAALKKANPAALPPGDFGRIALAGGVIGIVAIVLALGPFVSYGAFLLGLIAIILGAVGLHSSRPGWAITGIVLGVLAILLAGVLGVGVYVLVLHI
jgi:hypothetical protein